MFRKYTEKVKSLKVKALFKILDRINITSIYNLLYRYSLSRKKLNADIITSNKDKVHLSYYVQHIPDRYTFNLKKYKDTINFLSYSDLDFWVANNYTNNIGDINRFFFLNLCIDHLIEDNIKGNVAEVGVYKGNSAYLMTKYARHVGTSCYLFDTFEGFDSRDFTDSKIDKTQNDFSDTSLEFVKKIIGEENVIYVKGYFPDSLLSIEEPDVFSLVHVDCDLEKPFKAALNYFYPKLIKGGFLIMHDHSSLYWPKAKKAIDEFFVNKAEFVIPIPDKSGTSVIRKF